MASFFLFFGEKPQNCPNFQQKQKKKRQKERNRKIINFLGFVKKKSFCIVF